MKKIIIFLVLFFICGCSNKLTCTYEEDYEDLKIENKIIFNFKNNKYKQIDKMIFKEEDEAREYFKDMEEYIDEYNLILKENEIISELEDEIKLDGSKDEIKKQYENYDYKCK